MKIGWELPLVRQFGIAIVFNICFLVFYRFRRQHEQLRAVIMRVLRPASSETGTGASRKENRKSKDEEAMIDMADANAVNEVDMAYDNMKEVDGLDVSKEGTELWELSVKR